MTSNNVLARSYNDIFVGITKYIRKLSDDLQKLICHKTFLRTCQAKINPYRYQGTYTTKQITVILWSR